MKLQCKTDLMRSEVFSSVLNGKAGSEVIHLYDEYTANVELFINSGHIHTFWLPRSLTHIHTPVPRENKKWQLQIMHTSFDKSCRMLNIQI